MASGRGLLTPKKSHTGRTDARPVGFNYTQVMLQPPQPCLAWEQSFCPKEAEQGDGKNRGSENIIRLLETSPWSHPTSGLLTSEVMDFSQCLCRLKSGLCHWQLTHSL